MKKQLPRSPNPIPFPTQTKNKFQKLIHKAKRLYQKKKESTFIEFIDSVNNRWNLEQELHYHREILEPRRNSLISQLRSLPNEYKFEPVEIRESTTTITTLQQPRDSVRTIQPRGINIDKLLQSIYDDVTFQPILVQQGYLSNKTIHPELYPTDDASEYGQESDSSSSIHSFQEPDMFSLGHFRHMHLQRKNRKQDHPLSTSFDEECDLFEMERLFELMKQDKRISEVLWESPE